MKLVADANVWYDVSTGRIDPLQFNGPQIVFTPPPPRCWNSHPESTNACSRRERLPRQLHSNMPMVSLRTRKAVLRPFGAWTRTVMKSRGWRDSRRSIPPPPSRNLNMESSTMRHGSSTRRGQHGARLAAEALGGFSGTDRHSARRRNLSAIVSFYGG
jgi:hypothetical protein